MLVGGAAAALTAGAAYNHADALGVSETKVIFETLNGLNAKIDRIEKSINIPAMDTHKPPPNESRN